MKAFGIAHDFTILTILEARAISLFISMQTTMNIIKEFFIWTPTHAFLMNLYILEITFSACKTNWCHSARVILPGIGIVLKVIIRARNVSIEWLPCRMRVYWRMRSAHICTGKHIAIQEMCNVLDNSLHAAATQSIAICRFHVDQLAKKEDNVDLFALCVLVLAVPLCASAACHKGGPGKIT